MSKIITLTVNPAVDKSTSVAGVLPHKKLRCKSPVYEAGGGGINVSKVLHTFREASSCVYLGGGPAGHHLTELLHPLKLRQYRIPIEGRTRENLAVTDTKDKRQYRFGMPGPVISWAETEITLEQLRNLLEKDAILVASGSLCPGMPDDFYARVSHLAREYGARFILDSSGTALMKGAAAGSYLLKPNLGELATLCGVKTLTASNLEKVARNFLRENPCEILVVSMGAKGALLLTEESTHHIAAPVVTQKSTIGAGDSMVGGMVYALANGKSPYEMALFGVACGTAATMTEGSRLCRRKDAEKLYAWLSREANSVLSFPAL